MMRRTAWFRQPLLVLAAVAFALPLAYMLFGSLKPPGQPEGELLPDALHWRNYTTALASENYTRALANSILFSVATVVGTLVSCTLVAYGFSRITWPGRDVLFFVLVCTMLLPFHATMLPRFQMFAALGLYNTYWPLVLPSLLAQEAFYLFLLRQFFLTIPEELSEAARLDGASEVTILLRVILPLSWPALTTVAVFQFLATWNEFAGPLLYLSDPDKLPLAYLLQQFTSAYRTEFGPLMAAATMFTLPVLVLFVLAGNAFTKGIATTGLKG